MNKVDADKHKTSDTTIQLFPSAAGGLRASLWQLHIDGFISAIIWVGEGRLHDCVGDL